jgi:tRNA dimethylallyltransferase
MEKLFREKTLVVVVGPTAAGKTAASITIARHLNAEIVSADSRQIFKEMNIGTAKPSAAELAEVKHHFIDTHSVIESYDAASYGREALETINSLFRTSAYVVLCGGSGLYIKAVLEGFDEIPEIAEDVRRSIIEKYKAHGLDWLQSELKRLDPEYYSRIDHQNPQRLMRALEVITATGVSISGFQKKERAQNKDFRTVKVGLGLPREELYARIDRRMDEMINAGLFEEAKMLYPFRHHNALQTVGYQEIFGFIDGKYDHAEAVRLLKRNSRRYAKRQLTWFRRDPEIKWFSPFDTEAIITFAEGQSSSQSPEGGSV